MQRHSRIKGQARKSLWIETWQPVQEAEELYGQARKSLWIETGGITLNVAGKVGQARKSLWIETSNCKKARDSPGAVRLVRACGSKHPCRNRELVGQQVRLVRACGSKP